MLALATLSCTATFKVLYDDTFLLDKMLLSQKYLLNLVDIATTPILLNSFGDSFDNPGISPSRPSYYLGNIVLLFSVGKY